MAVILVSSCLLGCACRYKGDDCKNERILALAKEHGLYRQNYCGCVFSDWTKEK